MALVNVGVEVSGGDVAAAAAAPPVREWLVTLAADEDLKWFHGSAYDFLPM